MQRTEMLHELRDLLWSYLSDAAVATDLQSVTAGVLGVSIEDVRRVISARIALSEEARMFISAAPDLIRNLKASSATRTELTRGRVDGRVSWRRTQVVRQRSGGDPTLFVTLPSYRVYDHRRARVLKYALDALLERIRATDVEMAAATYDDNPSEGASTTTSRSMREALSRHSSAALRCLEHAKLSGVRLVGSPPQLITYGSNTGDDWTSVTAFVELLTEVDEATDVDSIADLVSRVIWAPASNGTLFEWLVGFRLVAAYRELDYKPVRMTASPSTTEPFAVLQGPKGTVSVHRQSRVREKSRYQRIRRAHGLRGTPLRPDFRIEHSWDPTDVIVETKHTLSEGTSPISQALAECLAYIYHLDPYYQNAPPPVALAVSSDSLGLVPRRDEVALCGPDGLPNAVALLLERA